MFLDPLTNLRRCLWFGVNWCATRHDPGKRFCWQHEKVHWHCADRWWHNHFAGLAVGWNGCRVRLVASYMENIAVSFSLLCFIQYLLSFESWLFLFSCLSLKRVATSDPHGPWQLKKLYIALLCLSVSYSILHTVWWRGWRGLPAEVDFQLVEPKPFFCAPKNITVENMSALQLFLHLLEKGWKVGPSSCKRKTPYKPGRAVCCHGCFRLSVGVRSWLCWNLRLETWVLGG